MAIDFTKVKDNQLAAYAQSLEKAIGLKEIAATADDLLQMDAGELADRMEAVKAEIQSRTIVPEPPPPPPTELQGWKVAEGYPRPSAIAKGTFDVRIVKGKRELEFLALSDGGTVTPLAWAVEQVAAMSGDDLEINDLNSKKTGERLRCPDPKCGEFVHPQTECPYLLKQAEAAVEEVAEVRRGN